MKIPGTITGFVLVAITIIVVYAMNIASDNGQKLGYNNGYQMAIGRPMKYKDLPRGQYKVIAVINEYSQTAVVQKQSLADGLIHEDAKLYFLVTDMMPQQMHVGYVWGEVE